MIRICTSYKLAAYGIAIGISAMAIQSAHAALLFSDNFDSSTSLNVQWNPYTGAPAGSNGSITVKSAPLTAPTSPNYAAISNTSGSILSLASYDYGSNLAFSPQTTLYVQFRLNVDANNSTAVATISGPNSGYPILFQFRPDATPGTYRLEAVYKDGSGNSVTDIVASELTPGIWEHWMFGIALDTSTPAKEDGKYSVYHEVGGTWQPVVQDRAFLQPYSNVTSDGLDGVRFQEYTNGSTLGVDDVKVYDTNPIPEPGMIGLLGVGGLMLLRRRSA